MFSKSRQTTKFRKCTTNNVQNNHEQKLHLKFRQSGKTHANDGKHNGLQTTQPYSEMRCEVAKQEKLQIQVI